MNATQILAQDDEKLVELTGQLRIAYQLKRTLRYSTVRDFSVHNESVAEHIFALIFLAQYFLPLEDPNKELSWEKVYEILLFHDFGEILNGDITYNIKTKEHEEQEREDAKKVFASLPNPLGLIGQKRWEEYENLETHESRFAYALDKIEPIFELYDPVNEKSLKRGKYTYQMHIEKKLKATEKFPVMRKFVDVVSEDMKSRGVFWED